MIFVIASHNKKKIEELERILSPLGIYAKTPEQLGKESIDVEETGTTFEENALLKAKTICELTGMPAIADDSGLVVDALGGQPGVYSARYAGPNATDADKIQKLLTELMKTGDSDRSAHFECVICCYFPNGETIMAHGRCDGTIGYAPRGVNGFGYDPIFFVEGNKTFAELSDNQKDVISHRGRALKEFSILLQKKYPQNG
ncbi:MAG TPA: non-canonical purine NTP pyrophosphatase [Ruminococcaceae bacterium]|nr:non-canonical purine NTP pyrophosphatase [Oscillospiraceae bacterium]